nr:MAG TPA: hypothetical protein [Caudoviricetes sp.]
MRVREPQPFDPDKEYKPGERCTYNGVVLIAEVWTKAAQRLHEQNPVIFPCRCARCKIERTDCPFTGRHCDRYSRNDRKQIYFRQLFHKFKK